MVDSTLMLLAKVVLPQEVLEHFDIVDIQSSETEIHIHLAMQYNGSAGLFQ